MHKEVCFGFIISAGIDLTGGSLEVGCILESVHGADEYTNCKVFTAADVHGSLVKAIREGQMQFTDIKGGIGHLALCYA